MHNDVSTSRIPADTLEAWACVRDVCAGDQALRRDEKYLPYLNKADHSLENVARNEAYRTRAVLFTATSYTRDGLVGLAFRHDPGEVLSDDAHLAYLLTDCDGSAISIYQQSQAVLAHVLEVGRHGLYVDYSEALAHPVIKSYLAENIINWRTSLVGGKTMLTLVVLSEQAEVFEGYALNQVAQYRELILENDVFTCRVWQKGDNKEPVLIEESVPRSRKGPLDHIPFHFVGAQNNDSTIDDAPLYGLARVNIAHFRNSADYEDSVFFVGQAQPWISGLDEQWRDHLESKGNLYAGSRTAILLPQGGSYGFAQALPNMLAKEAMDQKERQMLSLGARMIDASYAAKTATQSDNDKEATTSVLSICVGNVSEAYASAIADCARYMDLPEQDWSNAYRINQDFIRSGANAPLVADLLLKMHMAGLLSAQTLFEECQHSGILSAAREWETEQELIAQQAPAMPAMPTAPVAKVAPVAPPKPAADKTATDKTE